MTPIPAHVRAWIYRVALAVVPRLIAHGLITETDATLYVGVLVAVLDVGLAGAHTPTSTEG